MTKAFIYESIGGHLHQCLFAGLDNKGKPQWVVVDQAEEIMTLQDYATSEGLEDEELQLLCLKGEEVESSTMACLLGAVLESYGPYTGEMLSKSISRLRKWNISWKRDPLNMNVHILEYSDRQKGMKCYRFYIMGEGIGYVAQADGFDTLGAMMDYVYQFFSALMFEAGITCGTKRLFASAELQAQLSASDRDFFDEIG